MLPRIRVSDDRRFLATEQGRPFFWLADTAWELFHRLTREEARLFFATRRRQRFTVIQAVALAEFEGLRTPNAYGDLPLHDFDPSRPNDAYFRYVDELIDLAAAYDLYIGLLPTWGDKVTPLWGAGPLVFNAANAEIYGRFLGERYRDRTNLIWILGGDRPAARDAEDWRPIWRAMAHGIDTGTQGHATMTYHPNGGVSTTAWLHNEDWLDFNMMQSGHGGGRDVPVWDMISHDYALEPAKPTLDGEPNYEDHPVSPWPSWNPANGYFRDHDVRKQLYRSVFAGGCGVTYGHHAVWQFADPQRGFINHADRPWTEAIERPGANQVQHLRTLIESRPFFTRIPDQALLLSDPGTGAHHVCATHDAQGSFAMVYLPLALPVTVRLDLLAAPQIQAAWFDPCSGEITPIGRFATTTTPTFTPPGYRPDWVLLLDGA